MEKALLHVFTRSQAYAFPVRVEVEEVVEGEKIHYSAPAELSDFLFRYGGAEPWWCLAAGP